MAEEVLLVAVVIQLELVLLLGELVLLLAEGVKLVLLPAEVVKFVLLLAEVVWLAKGSSRGCVSAGEGSVAAGNGEDDLIAWYLWSCYWALLAELVLLILIAGMVM